MMISTVLISAGTEDGVMAGMAAGAMVGAAGTTLGTVPGIALGTVHGTTPGTVRGTEAGMADTGAGTIHGTVLIIPLIGAAGTASGVTTIIIIQEPPVLRSRAATM